MFSALRNPGTFYFGAANRDWTAPQNDALWQEEVKTLFDPCPAGWRVPRSGEEASGRNPWATFTAANGVWVGTDAAYSVSGRRWRSPQVFGGEAWYPTSCRRYYTSGFLQLWFCVASTTSAPGASSGLNFCYDDTAVRIADPHSRAHAHSVRCVRE